MRKAFYLIEMANSVISAYCRLENKTDSNQHFEYCPEVYYVICVIAELSRETAKNATHIDDDQNHENNLNAFQASKDSLWALSVSNQSQSRSRTILAFCSDYLGLPVEEYNFLILFSMNMSRRKRSNIL